MSRTVTAVDDFRRCVVLVMCREVARTFCERVRRCGLEVQIETSIRVSVEGRYGFDWEDAGQEKVRYEAYRYRLE